MAKLCYPWPPGESIRSEWGMRKHPITGKRKKHRGVDVGYNGYIYAPADGTVVHKGASLNKRTGGGGGGNSADGGSGIVIVRVRTN